MIARSWHVLSTRRTTVNVRPHDPNEDDVLVHRVYMRNSNMAQINKKQAAGVLFAGAVVGAAIALMSAPQSGVRTRKNIKKFARKTVDRFDDLQGDIRDQVANWAGDMTEFLKEGVHRGNKLGAEGYEQVLRGFDNAKKCVEDGRSRLEQLIKTA